MARTFLVPAGTAYPATLADYKLCLAKKPYRQTWADEDRTIPAPYAEIISSWLANGVKEVTE